MKPYFHIQLIMKSDSAHTRKAYFGNFNSTTLCGATLNWTRSGFVRKPEECSTALTPDLPNSVTCPTCRQLHTMIVTTLVAKPSWIQRRDCAKAMCSALRADKRIAQRASAAGKIESARFDALLCLDALEQGRELQRGVDGSDVDLNETLLIAILAYRRANPRVRSRRGLSLWIIEKGDARPRCRFCNKRLAHSSCPEAFVWRTIHTHTKICALRYLAQVQLRCEDDEIDKLPTESFVLTFEDD